jgi:hypothetical protein
LEERKGFDTVIAKTPFINGLTLSFPIGYFPDLFMCVGARTKKQFVKNLMDMEDEKKGGEGVPEETLIEMFRVGLMHIKPACTFEEAQEAVQDFLITYGHKKLDDKLVDAFVDSGIYDREYVEKQRKFTAEIEKINDERESALLKKAQYELDRLNGAIDDLITKAIADNLINASDIPGREPEPGNENDIEDEDEGEPTGDDITESPDNSVKSKLVKPKETQNSNKPASDPTRVKSNRRKPRPGKDPLEPPEILK